MSSSNEAAHQDPDHNPDILKRAADLKKKLQGPHLTPNQRKKLRKRLSRLFQPDGDMASDDSAQVEQSDDISRQTDETAAPSVCSHPLSPSHNAPHQHHDSNPDIQGSKRRKLGNLASCVAGSGSDIPPGSSTKAHSRMHGFTLSNAVISEDKSGPFHLPSYTARLSHNSASVVPEALPGASDDSRCTLQVPTRAAPRNLHGSIPHPSLHSKALQHSLAHALELKTSAAPVSIQQRRVPPNDFSSIMQLIAVQLRTSSAPPLKLVPEASAIAGSGRPSGAHFCRRDMSQEVSMISAELSLSGLVAGEICSKVKRGHDLISPPDNPHIMQESKCSPDITASQHTVDVTAVQAGSTKELEQSAEPSTAGAGDGVAGKAKSKKKQKVYPHGNYHNYYGYRALGSFDEDARLRLFKEEWFLNRDVLDVGCNEGLITLAVAARYKCRSVMGVDIDGTLIKRAKSNLREMRSRLSQQLNGYSGHQQGSSIGIAANSHAAQLVSCIFKPSREDARKSSSTCAELQVIPSASSDSCVPGVKQDA
ncbi:hypothetical protein CEUSTIGMA_g10891.t1 [Chlamydomonas eustigma]|uniref:RNA methyltransferase n=1 Tax=Chlamydomonas eustigma TaxID=1157962 RepID=A0A250XKC0_9CHLO|nr:hypothetical protein CEUSTIGMA_g10891.t1 [Chlamydomonas eustigma]|eukprot:GAX83466.1 hypothetical protein CEUSTIGMA_g10891.t1 [Chlamydomonas eustigma]